MRRPAGPYEVHGIDGEAVSVALRAAGLIPPVVELVADSDAGGEFIRITVLAPVRADLAEQITRVLGDVRHEIRYTSFEEDGRRPGVDYS